MQGIFRQLVLLALFWAPLAANAADARQDPPTAPSIATAQGTQAAQNPQNAPLRTMPLLASDEPNMLGWTRDSYERQGFMDFTLSLRYPLLYDTLDQGYKFNMLPFISFTGRMGQYFGRHSAPVVTKRFNPKLFFRFYEASTDGKKLWSDDNGLDYYDVGYAHESNGQHVDSVALFNAATASYGSAEIAQDYISRGWDYLGYRRHVHLHERGLNLFEVDLRLFLRHGLLQGSSEEFNYWEAPRRITKISQVDGIRLKLNYDFDRRWFKGASLEYITGYNTPFRNSTVRAELGFTPLSNYLGVPIVLWGQSGYLPNISQYYRRAWAVGIAASFETFS
jgi:outer membrane phospholipase A